MVDSAKEVICDLKATFTVSTPKENLYTTLKKIKNEVADLMQALSFAVQNMKGTGTYETNSEDTNL